MQSLVKMLLFLLVLPFLVIVFFAIVVPLGIILMFLSLFIPSIRLFHIFETPRGNPVRRDSAESTDNTVDVECTVVGTTEETDGSSDQNKDLKP